MLNYWIFKMPPYEELGQQEVQHVAPADGCVSIVLMDRKPQLFKMALVTGPTTDMIRTVVQPDTIYLGIRFVPGMFCAVFDVKDIDLKNQKFPAQHLLPYLDLQPLLQHLYFDFKDFGLIDDFLLNLLAQHPPVRYDEEVNRAVQLIMASAGGVLVKRVLENACLSERQLQKRFKRSTYLSMKELAKICRLHQTIIKVHLENKSISDAVYESGFFDQAHYNHNFYQSTGRKPEEFYKYISRIKHVDVKPVSKNEN
ncbi:helix-turn-helix domain-containing protein [Pontibacter locisalis]|uniref:Helix-turn-helix domain-containing protein n=1 Tax=Pontibacter locisalis TaxID=1719035 RepID=A0ABW5IH61_9BACT